MSWIGREALGDKPEISTEEVKTALDIACGQVLCNLERFTERFPKAYSVDGFYEATENVDWTTVFGRERSGWPMSTPEMGVCAGPGRYRWTASWSGLRGGWMWRPMTWVSYILLPAWPGIS